MTSALFVVSEEGYWGEECVDPLETLDDSGVDVTVATPSGNEPVVDERSVDPDEVGEETAERVREVHETDDRLDDPVPVASVDADEYDALVLPGGHGTEWDVNQDGHVRSLLHETVEGEDGVALVVCHAVGVLGFARDSGGFLVDGRTVTGFPTGWEDDIVDENDVMPDGRKLPYYVEDAVEAAGGRFEPEVDADTSVRVDGDLVTARGPASSREGATTLLSELGER